MKKENNTSLVLSPATVTPFESYASNFCRVQEVHNLPSSQQMDIQQKAKEIITVKCNQKFRCTQ